MLASKLRKGTTIRLHTSWSAPLPEGVPASVVCRVSRKEKWNNTRTKLHLEDIGNGLPFAQFGTQWLGMKEVMVNSDAEIEVIS